MHSHWAELSSLGIVVEGIANFMTTVAAILAEPVNQGYLDSCFAHGITPKGKSCNIAVFGVQYILGGDGYERHSAGGQLAIVRWRES